MACTGDMNLDWLFALAPFWIIHAIPPDGIDPPAGSPTIISLGCWSKQPMLLASHGAAHATQQHHCSIQGKICMDPHPTTPDRTEHQVRLLFQSIGMDCWSSACKQGHRQSDDDKSSSQPTGTVVSSSVDALVIGSVFDLRSVVGSSFITMDHQTSWISVMSKNSRAVGPAPMSWEPHLAKALDQSTGLIAQVNLHSQGSMLLLFFRALLFGGNGDETQIVFHGRCHASSTKQPAVTHPLSQFGVASMFGLLRNAATLHTDVTTSKQNVLSFP